METLIAERLLTIVDRKADRTWRVPQTARLQQRIQRAKEDGEGWETILLVEDEDTLRRVTRIVLELGGYRVLEARDGREALEICERHTDLIHLMITDVVLPEMNGSKIAQRVARFRPRVRTLFVSGHTESAIHHYGVLDSGVDFLQKPVDVNALLHKVREILDRPTLLVRDRRA